MGRGVQQSDGRIVVAIRDEMPAQTVQCIHRLRINFKRPLPLGFGLIFSLQLLEYYSQLQVRAESPRIETGRLTQGAHCSFSVPSRVKTPPKQFENVARTRTVLQGRPVGLDRA